MIDTKHKGVSLLFWATLMEEVGIRGGVNGQPVG